MDYDKLYLLLQEKLFTDLTLVIRDKSNQIIIDINKNILYASCVYFEKLLTNCKEKTLNNIAIEVPNTYVVNDIIMSFYGQQTNSGNLSQNKHLFESIKCRNFFNMNIDSSLLDNIKVSQEDFELLLDVIEIVGYDDKTIDLINKNLPEEYDLTKFPEELLNEMLEIAQIYTIASVGSDGDIKIYNTKTSCLLKTFNNGVCPGYSANIAAVCISYSSSNNHIAYALGYPKYDIQIRDMRTYELLCTLAGHEDQIRAICYSSNGKYIASASSDTTVKIWDTEKYTLVHTLLGHIDEIWSISYSPDNKFIVSGSSDRTVKIWSIESGTLVKTLSDHVSSVFSVCYSPNNKYIATGTYDSILKIWDSQTYALIKTLKNNLAKMIILCYSPNSEQIISAHGNTIIVWNAILDKKISHDVCTTLYGHRNDISSICFSPCGKWMASASYQTINIWNAYTHELVNAIFDDNMHIYDICFLSIYDEELVKKIDIYYH
jgi:WD40 repeat protein